MSSQSSVLTQSVTGVVPSGHQRVTARAYSTAVSLSSTPTPTQVSGPQDEPPSSPVSEVSLYCDAVQSQHSSDAETQPPPPSSAPLSTNPATTAPDDVWNFSEPVPGSKAKKLIAYKAPFEWGQWPGQEWQERFFFVKDQLATLVYIYLRLIEFTTRPTYSARMVGASPSGARPALLVTCRDADFENIRKLFHSKAAEALCPGKVPAVSQLRASVGRRGARTGPAIPRLQMVYYRTATPVSQLTLTKPLAVSLGTGNTTCGAMIRYGERSATLGVTLDVRGEPRILTVDYLFSPTYRKSSESALIHYYKSTDLPGFFVLADLHRTDPNRL